MNLEFARKLPEPSEIKKRYPISKQMAEQKAKRDADIAAVFRGESDKFILVIGPCSADAKEPVLEYIARLAKVQEKVADKVLIIPRIYTNKPRTTGAGYKGMLHQPDPSSRPDMLGGIIAIRDLHLCALKDYGFSSADEMLYPENHRYLSDLLSYVAVGARSVENQQHRLTASGIKLPVGMKNPTEGDLHIMMNAITAAQSEHTFIYGGWEVRSKGNDLCHAILRGYVTEDGKNVSNYHYEDLLETLQLYQDYGLKNPAVIVDTNHANSGKKYLEQIRIAEDVCNSVRHNADLKKFVKGLMIESYLIDGAQKIGENTFGKSITDPCLGWEKTERLILDIADQI